MEVFEEGTAKTSLSENEPGRQVGGVGEGSRSPKHTVGV